MNDTPKRKLRLKAIHNETYDTDEILGMLKYFEDKAESKAAYNGALAYVCTLLNIKPEDIWTMLEYIEQPDTGHEKEEGV